MYCFSGFPGETGPRGINNIIIIIIRMKIVKSKSV